MSDKEKVFGYIEMTITMIYMFIWFYLIAITTTRMIKKLRQIYIDWIYVLWCIFILLALFSDIISTFCVYVFFFQLGTKSPTIRFAVIIVNWIDRIAFYWYTSLSTLYPALLILYSYKLNGLTKGLTFLTIKSKINFSESLLVGLIFTIWLIFLIFYGTIAILLYVYDWLDIGQQNYRNEGLCEKLKWIQYSRYCFHFIYCVALLVIYIFVFNKLIKVMKQRLHYFYQLTKHKIRVLYVSGVMYLLGQSTFTLIDMFHKANDSIGWKLSNDFNVGLRIFWLALYLFCIISVFV